LGASANVHDNDDRQTMDFAKCRDVPKLHTGCLIIKLEGITFIFCIDLRLLKAILSLAHNDRQTDRQTDNRILLS